MLSSKKDKEPYNSPSKRDKEKEKALKGRPAVAAPTERLKTVVRRLPPNLPEVVFWQSVQQWVSDETVTWKVFHPGKVKKKSVPYFIDFVTVLTLDIQGKQREHTVSGVHRIQR